ncbi:MAG: hypothetical protein KGL98_12330 [Gammaproteobacteria bacterium]|nr:hypothetical protein [Gammaproteobacteria bacterium]MDE1984305.1 hypothetical protein [Gammaproteobacteria bacterium]MDE2108875.1 hypothetical protein [Gammaproteobacteria bacterium]MDE2462012.1 hypothetical protein [Gammaproteobacteria bacterium]
MYESRDDFCAALGAGGADLYREVLHRLQKWFNAKFAGRLMRSAFKLGELPEVPDDVREYAQNGMQEKAVEFKQSEAEIYRKAEL